MARHRKTSSHGNRLLILVQILIMAGVLVFIIFFRDTIGSGASSAFDTVAGTEDIQVDKANDSDNESESAAARDDNAAPAGVESDAGNKDRAPGE
jgi:cytoskeletal protein RodZ